MRDEDQVSRPPSGRATVRHKPLPARTHAHARRCLPHGRTAAGVRGWRVGGVLLAVLKPQPSRMKEQPETRRFQKPQQQRQQQGKKGGRRCWRRHVNNPHGWWS
eukprot:358495-Chlamydomonas_euryale.AAC.7